MAKIIFFLFAFALHAEILQTNRMEEVLNHVDETSWVLFDIDDTLLESSIQAGRAKWYFHEVAKLMKEGHGNESAQLLFYPEWIHAQEICPVRTPEPQIAALVQKIQSSAAAVFGLTARHPPAAEVTIRQLEKLDISFGGSAPSISLPETTPPIRWEKGVLFVSDFNPKGTTFRKIVEALPTKPAKIVFVDDGKHHLIQMEEEMAQLGIPFTGIHYTRAHERPFDAEIAELEYKQLKDRESN